MTVRVTPLECGWITTDAGSMVTGETGRFRMPVGAFLVEHARGAVVFDTGMHPSLVHDTTRLGPLAPMFDVHLDGSGLMASRLGEAGMDPADVDIAVLSHLHFDHAGGLCQLPEARVLVQEKEWRAAFHPVLVEHGVYTPADVDLGHDRTLLDGEHDVFGDGSVRIVPTPGHTIGHQSLLVEGRLLLVGDACYCRVALDRDALPAFSFDAERQRACFAWLREQEADGVQLVFSHDADQWRNLPEVL